MRVTNKTSRDIFGQIDNLKSQKVKPGGVAVLKDNNRYVYYMVTKELSRGKPTYFTLNESLHAMRDHMVFYFNNISLTLHDCRTFQIRAKVTKVAMPRIGCGLDGLEWEKVKEMLEDVFKDQNIDVTVYNFVPK